MRIQAIAGKWGWLWMALIWLGLGVATVQAGVEPYSFDTQQQEERFQKLTYELRCPKCQNQNIADSNAEIAQDLRAEVHRLLQDDRTDAEIVSYMVDRYGEFVRYRPAFSGGVAVLWVLPGLGVLLAFVVAWFMLRKRRLQSSESSELQAEESQRLDELIQRHSEKDPSP